MSLNDFIHQYSLKNKATSNTKTHEVSKKMGLDSKTRNYFRDGNFSTNFGVLNLHVSEGTHWVCYLRIVHLIPMAARHIKKFLIA